MGQYGQLRIRLYVNHKRPDEYGRLQGRWRTLHTWWIERSQVDATLVEFIGANPGIKDLGADLDVEFTMREHMNI